MMVDDVVKEIVKTEPSLNKDQLHKTVGYSLSMLAKDKRVKKYPFNRHIKYSL